MPSDWKTKVWKGQVTHPRKQSHMCELAGQGLQSPTWACIPGELRISLNLTSYLHRFCLQITGPWRSLWIRFGYDPRKRPEAKIYQVLDFRIRCGMKYGKQLLKPWLSFFLPSFAFAAFSG